MARLSHLLPRLLIVLVLSTLLAAPGTLPPTLAAPPLPTGTPSSGDAQPDVAFPAVANVPAVPLPQGCGGVTPGDQPLAVCCISGYVWMEGRPIRGASVTVEAANGHRLTLVTDIHPDGTQPYYHTALSGPPLNIQAGQTITITASYSSHTRSERVVVQQGGQQVDVVLSKSYAQDYMFERKIQGVGEPGKFSEPTDVAVDTQGNVYIVDSGDARIQVFNSRGQFLYHWKTRSDYDVGNPLKIDISDAGFVYVTNIMNAGIQKFDLQGGFLGYVNVFSRKESIDYNHDISVDKNGYIYLLKDGFVDKLNRSGDYLYSLRRSNNANIQSVQAIALDFYDNIYVMEESGTLHKFASNGIWLEKWGYFEAIERNCGNNRIDVDIDHFIYVYACGRVNKIDRNGRFMVSWGNIGENCGSFWDVRGISISKNGFAYIVNDGGDNNVQVFTLDGTYLSCWGGKSRNVGQLSDPQGIAFDSKGNIYIADYGNHRIQKFNPLGKFILSWGENGIGIGQFQKPNNISVDPNNNIYVSDESHRIQKFTEVGKYIDGWYGGEDTGFRDINDMIIDNLGNIYILDTEQRCIRRFNAENGSVSNNWCSDDNINISSGYRISFDLGGNIYLCDEVGDIVKVFDYNGIHMRDIFLNRHFTRGLEGFFVDRFGVINVVGKMINDEVGEERWMYRVDSNGRVLGAWEMTHGLNESISNSVYEIQVKSDGRIYVANQSSVQVFRLMTYHRPIATISAISNRSLVQGTDTLTAVARAADSDNSGDPALFSYRWYIDGQQFAGGQRIDIPATMLSVGAKKLTLEVVDDEGDVSPPVSIVIDINSSPKAIWTYMLYMVADTWPDGDQLLDQMDQGFGNGLLARMQRQQGARVNHQVQVVVQIDAYGHGNTRRQVLERNGTWRVVWRGERAMDDADSLSEFVTWSKRERPADHYYLAILSHGNGYQGVAWDDTSGPGSYLTITEMRQALENAGGERAGRIDVLHLDACSMGLLDVAYELRDSARYLVASQNLAWSFFLQDRYLSQTDDATTPRQLGTAIVRTYASYAEQESTAGSRLEQYPYTIALLDLDRVTPTVREFNHLIISLGAYASQGASQRAVLNQLRAASQQFDSQDFYRITLLDEYVDLINWAEQLHYNPDMNVSSIRSQADVVIKSVIGDNPLVVSQYNSATRFYMPVQYGGTLTDLRRAHGISVYYPHPESKSIGTLIWQRYQNDELFQLTTDTQWNEFLRVGNPGLPIPDKPLPEPERPRTVFENQPARIFLPILRR